MPKCIIYKRFSPRPNADESQSNEKQEERCREYARGRGYEVVASFEDSDRSGGDYDDEFDAEAVLDRRPGLLRALDALKRGYVLVVRWRSRIARSVFVQDYVHRVAASKGARVEAADESNGDSPDQKLLRHFLAGIAEWQRQINNLMTSRGMKRNQAAGMRMGRADRCPFGFQPDPADPKALIHSASEQATLARMKELRASGETYRSICRILDDEGHVRRGKRWEGCPALIKAILQRNGVI